MSRVLEQQQSFARLMRDADASTDELSNATLDVETGLEVYRNNLKLAWRNALKATFPVLSQLLGDDGIALLAQDYLQKYPSQSGDLNDLGMNLSAFLTTYTALNDYPYLSEVALLEWFAHLAHGAANHTPLAVADLMVHGTEEWLAAQVEYAPSVFLLKTNTAAASIWLAHQPDADLSALHDKDLISQSECILISRPSWRVEIHVLDAGTYAFLTQLKSGLSFEQAFEYMEQQDNEFDFVTVLPKLLEFGIWKRIIFTNIDS